jgi:hypothetical protein
VAGSEQDRDLERSRDLRFKPSQERRAQPDQLDSLRGLRAVIDAVYHCAGDYRLTRSPARGHPIATSGPAAPLDALTWAVTTGDPGPLNACEASEGSFRGPRAPHGSPTARSLLEPF